MGIARTALVSGPAKALFDSAAFYSKEDIVINLNESTFNIETSAHGKIDERTADIVPETTFTPAGNWTNLTKLWPYGNTAIGASIFGGTDKPLALHGSDGQIHSLVAAAVTKMPDLHLGAKQTIIKPVTFSGVRKDGANFSADDSLYTVATSGAAFVDATFTTASIITQGYTAEWGAVAGFAAFRAKEGWDITFDLQLEPIVVDDLGTLDMRLKSLSVMAKCIPLGPTMANILAARKIQGTGAAVGRSYNATAANLVITGTGVVVTLTACDLKEAGFRFGPSVLRQGEIGFVATRNFSSGAQQALFTLGTGS